MTAPQTAPAEPRAGMAGLLKPFRGIRPTAEFAAQVAAPPYDVLSVTEARARAAGNPWSFLHVSRPEIDLADGIDAHAPEVYEAAGRNMKRMLVEGVLRRDDAPAYYVYRADTGTHVQTGLVLAASIAAYETGRIRRHELTRPDKVEDRARQIDAVGAQTGPVMLVHRRNDSVEALLGEVTARQAAFSVVADGGVRHSLWPVGDETEIAALTDAFEAMEALYIADGHHRSAAAERVAVERRGARKARNGNESYEYFLAVSFPEDEVRILDYNRVVRDLGGHDVAGFLAEVGKQCEMRPSESPVRPDAPHQLGMYVGGRWYHLALASPPEAGDDPVAGLDVALLAETLLGPVLGVGDPRTDRRIEFIGGVRGLDELARRVDSGEMAVAFALFPTRIADLLAVADAGGVMPPKSTWFEPKLADGLISYPLD